MKKEVNPPEVTVDKYVVKDLPPMKELFEKARAIQIQKNGGIRRRSLSTNPAFHKIVFR